MYDSSKSKNGHSVNVSAPDPISDPEISSNVSPPSLSFVNEEEGPTTVDQLSASHSPLSNKVNQKHEDFDSGSECSSWDSGLSAQDPTYRRHGGNAISHKKSVSFIHDMETGRDVESLIRGDNDDNALEDIPEVVVNPGRLLAMVFSCAKWSKARFRATILGCFSSVAVLVIRLQLDSEPLAYFIHSIVVFFDMVLIHLFTNSAWLSILGELVTIAMFLAFHFTKESVWELLETTLLAMLCSFHLISSRNKHMTRQAELQQDLKTLCRQTSALLQHSSNHPGGLTRQESIHHLERMRSEIFHWDSERTVEMEPQDNDHIEDLSDGGRIRNSAQIKKAKIWGEQFFEHFLDGSAGVMVSHRCSLSSDKTKKAILRSRWNTHCHVCCSTRVL
jgi:hypothetical protein